MLIIRDIASFVNDKSTVLSQIKKKVYLHNEIGQKTNEHLKKFCNEKDNI